MFKRFIRKDEGSITPVMFCALALIILLCVFIADFGMFILTMHRAQDAADAAALSAVQESFPLFSSGSNPETVAKRYSRENGASLETLEVFSGGTKAQVEVSVKVKSLILEKFGITPEEVRAKAAAEVDMEALIASNDIWLVDPSIIREIVASLGPLSNHQSSATMVVLLALQHLGEPYVSGAQGPNKFDCSGLVYYVYAQVGIRLPRVTFDQVRVGKAVSLENLEPGDLVFFRKNGHVGIYIGAGQFIHAPRTGDVVKISPLSKRKDISACRRII
ncbi:MAG: C40 family peptidase [Actinomycetota bacterium]|nr:C40 family peptidase [Actinomycetota bacterium]